jgi:hypothetical protein
MYEYDRLLFIQYVPERTFHRGEDTMLVRITHGRLRKILQSLYFLELGYFLAQSAEDINRPGFQNVEFFRIPDGMQV